MRLNYHNKESPHVIASTIKVDFFFSFRVCSRLLMLMVDESVSVFEGPSSSHLDRLQHKSSKIALIIANLILRKGEVHEGVSTGELIGQT